METVQTKQNETHWHKHTYHRRHHIMPEILKKISKTMLICNGNLVYRTDIDVIYTNIWTHRHEDRKREREKNRNRHTYHALFNVQHSYRMLVIVLMIYCYYLPCCRSLPASTLLLQILAESEKELRVRAFTIRI